MGGSEMETYLKHYLRAYCTLKGHNFDDTLAKELPLLKDQVYRCMMMSHFQWAFWCFIMMPHDKLDTEQGVQDCIKFYLKYARQRMEMYVMARNTIWKENPSKLTC